MEELITNDILIVPFPFSDLSDTKKRPVLVVATPRGDDIILCQITSQNRHDRYAIARTDRDVIEGGLKVNSYIRPNRYSPPTHHSYYTAQEE